MLSMTAATRSWVSGRGDANFLTRRSMLVASKMPMMMGKLSSTIYSTLRSMNRLMVDGLADDDPLQFHLDRHGTLTFQAGGPHLR